LVQITALAGRCEGCASHVHPVSPLFTFRKGATMSHESPTVVLVHGAFADASSWNGVIERLRDKGVNVTAPANPLRGIAHDSAYIASVFEQTPGPVLAVGHSYGGGGASPDATHTHTHLGGRP